jgi:hypothetical protein
MATPSTVISMRLPLASSERLKRLAKRFGWTPSDASARLVEEGLRRSEFAFIDFRNSSIGRVAYVQGSTLAVWEVIMVSRGYDGDVAATAKHLRWPEVKVRAAFNYAKAFSGEVESILAENDAMDFEALSKMLPQAEKFVVRENEGKR